MTNVLIQGWRGLNHSYALVNQYQILEMAKMPGLTLSHQDLPFYNPRWNPALNASGFDAARAAAIDAIPGPGSSPPDVIYRIAFPYRLYGGDAKRVLVFGTSETGTLLPAFFYDGPDAKWPYKNEAFEIVTPSNWSKTGFVAYGFAPERVHIVPLGIDPATFRPMPAEERAEARRQNGFPDDLFIFANVGSMVNGKGIDVLLLAFDAVHRKYPNTALLLKDQRNLYGIKAEDWMAALYQENPSRFAPTTFQSIIVVDGNLSLDMLRTTYCVADAYVSPYRCEGFNMPPLEAAASGLPVLVTDGGATDDYAHPSFATKIASTRVAKGAETLLEPDLDSTIAGMEALVERRTAHDPAKAVAWIGENFSWAKATEKLVALF